jgi:hypothetical protein
MRTASRTVHMIEREQFPLLHDQDVDSQLALAPPATPRFLLSPLQCLVIHLIQIQYHSPRETRSSTSRSCPFCLHQLFALRGKTDGQRILSRIHVARRCSSRHSNPFTATVSAALSTATTAIDTAPTTATAIPQQPFVAAHNPSIQSQSPFATPHRNYVSLGPTKRLWYHNSCPRISFRPQSTAGTSAL